MKLLSIPHTIRAIRDRARDLAERKRRHMQCRAAGLILDDRTAAGRE
jgi:hypothetical protein